MQFRRKKKFINAKSQLSFAFWLILNALVFVAMVMIVLFIPPLADWLNPGLNYSKVFGELSALLLAKWPFLVLIAVIMIVLGNLFSIRIFGPEYRFKQILISLINKELNIFCKLRKWDYHQDLEKYFKEHVNSLKETVITLKKSSDEANNALSAQDIQKAKEALGKIKSELDKYKF